MKELSIDELYSNVHNELNNTERKLEFHRRIIGNDFLVVLQNGYFDDDLRPRIFDTQEGKFLLCFESNEKLTNFITQKTAHVLLSFKEIIKLIKNKKIGIAINIGKHSGILLDLKVVEWIEQVISSGQVEELGLMPIEFEFPHLVDESLLGNLKIVLETMSGMTKKVILAQAHYNDLNVSFFLGFIDSPKLFHKSIKERVLDVVKLHKSDSVFLDVAFLSSSTELASKLSINGLTILLPRLQLGKKTKPSQSHTSVPKLR